jgi:hypothetical protein
MYENIFVAFGVVIAIIGAIGVLSDLDDDYDCLS